MFQYEYEKRPHSSSSCGSRAPTLAGWDPPASVSRPPLPPRPRTYQRMPTKTTVPLKVWVIASASCFAVCAALVLATVVITKWGSSNDYTRHILGDQEELFSNPHPIYVTHKLEHSEQETTTNNNEIDTDMEIMEKLSIFKNVVAQRTTKKDLVSKPQIHPLHDTAIVHAERKIEKKDQAKFPGHLDLSKVNIENTKRPVPVFKPTLPDVYIQDEVKLPDGYLLGLRKPNPDYEDYYSDDNLYEDYMQSNSMTNYLIEKIQELHDWINSDPDFESVKNSSKIARNGSEFTELLKALNQSLVRGDVTIVMSKLRDLYIGDGNNVTSNHPRKMITSNSTDLLSFGILTLDIMLLHNIQLMAWENQESSRAKMLKDPDVFAFNALFMEPSKVEASQNEINRQEGTAMASKRHSLHQDSDELDLGSSLLDNFLEIGVSTTRAAINLGRAYKNTKVILAQLSSNDATLHVHGQRSRNIDGSTVALNHLQSSFNGGVINGTYYTELDCLWLLYCRNLVATTKLDAPYGIMARINGLALRLVTGEVPADRALHAALLDALGGWTDLHCDNMFPRCSKVNASSVVLRTILQPSKS